MIKRRNTKQKECIKEYFSENIKNHINAEEIINNTKVSKATLYRILKQLEEEHYIRKYYIAGDLKACYQVIDVNNKCNLHYHLFCNNCEDVLHFENNNVNKLEAEILKENNFEIDLDRVMFYGVCDNCKVNKKGNR